MNALNRCIFAAALLAPLLAQAATFTVNSTADPGDGSCDASECTLREAITAANANANATEVDMIYFGVAGGGVHSIQPMEALPTIIEPVLIDGYQSPQAGATPWSLENGVEIPPILVIELNGDAIAEGKPNGLTFAAGSEGSTLRGLVINGWEEAGVRITGVAGVNIEGNIFGLDASGLNAKPHEGAKSRAGVHIDGPSTVTVGGPAISQRNVLGGFDDNGSSTAGISTNSGGHTLVIENNFIGTIITGDRSAGGNGHGIYRGTFGAFDIPSTVTIRDNLISGNGRHGVNFSGSGTSSFTGSIVSNRIGVAYASNDEVSNGGDGIQWRDGEVTIGGDSAELGNVIAHNAGYGVNGLGAGLYARHNAIFANGNLGLRGNVRAVEVLSAWVRHDGSSLIRF
ncbi:MAG: CSLREA domain-containing protein, partial [Oceanococcaceae bacterium]